MAIVSVVAPVGVAGGGRRTFLDVIDELSRPLDADDATVRAVAGDAFRAAVRKMNTKGLWPWEVQEEDLTITANEKFSSAQSAIKKPLSMHYLSAAGGTEDQSISYIPYDEFVERYSFNLTGEASVYTVPNLFETGQVRWFPTPSGNDNVRFAFYRVTPIPKTESEPLEIPEYAVETYMAAAWVEFVKRLPVAQQFMPMATAYAEWKSAFKELSAHVNTPGDRSRIVQGP